jgi:hypothetical protein
MSAVTMIPINAAKTRVPGKGLGVVDRLVPTLAVAPRAKRKTVVAVLLAMSEAMTVAATARRVIPRGVPFPAHRVTTPGEAGSWWYQR